MEFVVLILVGIGVGTISGMFGIGGAVLMTPILILIGFDDNIALATPLVGAVFSAIGGSVGYIRKKLVDYRTGSIVAVSALATSWIGIQLSGLSVDVMIYIKIAFMLVLAIRLFITEKEVKPSNPNIFSAIAIGAFTGVFSAMIAIGGGLIFIFAFTSILHLDIKRTIATSLFCVGILSIVNSILHYQQGNIDLSVAFPIIIGTLPAAQLGAYISVKLPNNIIRRTFGITLSIFAIFFTVYRIFGFF